MSSVKWNMSISLTWISVKIVIYLLWWYSGSISVEILLKTGNFNVVSPQDKENRKFKKKVAVANFTSVFAITRHWNVLPLIFVMKLMLRHICICWFTSRPIFNPIFIKLFSCKKCADFLQVVDPCKLVHARRGCANTVFWKLFLE